MDTSTIKHLRFPFSFFLLPVFVFALSQADSINLRDTLIAFFSIHLLVFPASNGYNSYQDKDETSIGGLKNPPKVNKNLFYITMIFDVLAVSIGLIISLEFSLMLLVFISMSRAYSFRGIRLKQYPVIGFLTVFIFQGAFIYLTSLHAITGINLLELLHAQTIICMAIASLFMGSMYPLTQIYQHASDKKDGVISISYKLGYIGTFIFSGILFFLGAVLLGYYAWFYNTSYMFWIFIVLIIPVVIRMSRWFKKVRQNRIHANFENTMSMNLISSVSMNLYFVILALNNYYNWL